MKTGRRGGALKESTFFSDFLFFQPINYLLFHCQNFTVRYTHIHCFCPCILIFMQLNLSVENFFVHICQLSKPLIKTSFSEHITSDMVKEHQVSMGNFSCFFKLKGCLIIDQYSEHIS